MSFVSRQDIRTAWRALRRTPAMSVSALVCLALGLGVTTAIASALDRALLQPLPFRAPEQLVTVYRTTPQFDTGPFSPANYTDLAASASQVRSLAAAGHQSVLLTLADDALQLAAIRVTGDLFPLLGAQAAAGRLLTPADDAPDGNPVVVLGARLWRDRFGSDPAIVGQSINIDGTATTVVGVAPPEFRIPHGMRVLDADIWLPMRFPPHEAAQRGSNYLLVLGRLADRATAASATSEMQRLFGTIVEAHPQLRGESVRVVAMAAEGTRGVRTPLLLLFGAVVFVLLIASINVAALLLARGVQRRREMAVRTALGGGRWAVMRPVLTESVLLSCIGLALGLLLAWAGVRTIGALAAERIPQLNGLTVDMRVGVFAVVLALIVAVVCGAIPAWRGASTDPQEALGSGRGGGTGRAHHRALGALVVAEVALSLVLIVGAGLVLKGFARLMEKDPGFDPSRLLTLETAISPQRYQDGTVLSRFVDPALDAIGQLPGVEHAAAIDVVPYVNWGWNFNIRYEGEPADDITQRPITERRIVTPGFFAVTQQRLVAGRLLDASDDGRSGTLAVVANEALVRRDFAGRDPIGRRFHLGDTTFATIVGVVSDIRNFGPIADPRPEVYGTYHQWQQTPTSIPIVVRVSRGDPSVVTAAVREAIRGIDPGAAVMRVAPMQHVIDRSVGQPRFYLMLLGAFAAVALALAIAGLYGVMSYSVAQRTREFGVRMALGSPRSRTISLVAVQGGRLLLIGIVVGVAGGVALTRLLQGMLYGVSPLDVVTWGGAVAALTAAGVVASLVPAHRATRIDPLQAIRSE